MIDTTELRELAAMLALYDIEHGTVCVGAIRAVAAAADELDALRAVIVETVATLDLEWDARVTQVNFPKLVAAAEAAKGAKP